jgi:hypothetical protein
LIPGPTKSIKKTLVLEISDHLFYFGSKNFKVYLPENEINGQKLLV